MHSGQRWICCQIGAREHYAVARALNRHAALEMVITDAWVKPGNLLGVVNAGLRARFQEELAGVDVYGPTVRNIAFELRSRFLQRQGWQLTMARNCWFQRLAVSKLSRLEAGNKEPILMSYSYAAGELFELARARGWRTVLGQIDPGPREEEIVSRLHESSSHGSSWERAPKDYWARWRHECTLADRIVVNSSWSREALVAEGISKDKIKVVPLAYEQPAGSVEFRREYPPSFDKSRPLQVLFLGQVNLRKGVAPVLEAIRLLRGEPIEFTFVGPVQISIPLDLRNNPTVHWRGSVPRHATSEFYRSADVFVFPTFSDGFGLTQLEAQAWKLPVITTRYCGNVVRHGRDGWILSEITPNSIAMILYQCLREPQELRALSNGCLLDGSFDLTNVGAQWSDVFR